MLNLKNRIILYLTQVNLFLNEEIKRYYGHLKQKLYFIHKRKYPVAS